MKITRVLVAWFLLALADNACGCSFTVGGDPSYITGNTITCPAFGCTDAAMQDCELVVCTGVDSCLNSDMTNIAAVECNGETSCELATILGESTTTVSCDGTSSCWQATIGTESEPVANVDCNGSNACGGGTLHATSVVCRGGTMQEEACRGSTVISDCMSCEASFGCDSSTCSHNGEGSCTDAPACSTECRFTVGGDPSFITDSTIACPAFGCTDAAMQDCELVVCTGVDSCLNSDMTNITTVECNGETSCELATILGVQTESTTTVTCDGTSSCWKATIHATSVVCRGGAMQEESCRNSAVISDCMLCEGTFGCDSTCLHNDEGTCTDAPACPTMSPSAVVTQSRWPSETPTTTSKPSTTRPSYFPTVTPTAGKPTIASTPSMVPSTTTTIKPSTTRPSYFPTVTPTGKPAIASTPSMVPSTTPVDDAPLVQPSQSPSDILVPDTPTSASPSFSYFKLSVALVTTICSLLIR